jgi:hypothetical protein
MKKLKEKYGLNHMDYELEKRTKKVAMFRVLSRECSFVCYEVFNIPTRKPDKYNDFTRETLVSNEEFGRKHNSKCFVDRKLAEKHWNKLVGVDVGGRTSDYQDKKVCEHQTAKKGYYVNNIKGIIL